jgi:hypothetical protein
VLHAQVTPTNIVYALVDSSDWIQGVELRLCAPCWPTCLTVSFTTHPHRQIMALLAVRTLQKLRLTLLALGVTHLGPHVFSMQVHDSAQATLSEVSASPVNAACSPELSRLASQVPFVIVHAADALQIVVQSHRPCGSETVD